MGVRKVLIFTCLLVLGGIIYPFSALAIYKDDFKLADSSEVHSNIWVEIRPIGNQYFVASWVDMLTGDPGFDGYIRKYTIDGVPTGNTIKLGDDSLEVRSPIFLGLQKNGNIVAAWLYHDIVHPPYRDWVTARIYDSLFNPITPEIKVDTITDSTRWMNLRVDGLGVDSANNFVVLYAVEKYRAFLQKFSPTGDKIGDPVGVYTPYEYDDDFPCQDSAYLCNGGYGWDMTMLPSGELIVVYGGGLLLDILSIIPLMPWEDYLTLICLPRVKCSSFLVKDYLVHWMTRCCCGVDSPR